MENSMEDGVVILVSKGPVVDDVQEPVEYRVAYVESVPKLYGPLSDTTRKNEPDSEYILDKFFEADVYTDGDDAYTYADLLASEVNHEMEYGVVLLNVFADREFSSY